MMRQNKNSLPVAPLLVAQDLSAIGSLSLQVALPILSAFDLPLAALSTNLFSTQTEGFNPPAAAKIAPWLLATFHHWQQQKLTFSGLLLGYLGTNDLVAIIQQLVARQSLPTIIFDPVMADQNALYPDLPADYPYHLAKLLPYATVITPNLTEAQLLTGITVGTTPTQNEQYQLLKALEQKLSAHGHAVITSVVQQQQIGCIWLTHGRLQFSGYPRLPGHFYGSGDVLTALLTGFLQHGEGLPTAIKYAVNGTFLALQQTAHSQRERRYGIILSDLLFATGQYLRGGQFLTK